MQTKFFCDLYVSEGWEKKKLKLIKKLQKNKLQPSVYVITLSQGKQNHLEYYSSLLLKQHIFDNAACSMPGFFSLLTDCQFVAEGQLSIR